MKTEETGRILLEPIGFVCNAVQEKKDTAWGGDVSVIRLQPDYVGGLKGLEEFSHVIVLFYLDRAKYIPEKHLQRRPQNREDMPLRGIFAQRGKDRPNQIGITSVEVLAVSDTELTVKGLDAIDGTPILDIKPYYPVYDRKNAVVPEWVEVLMKEYF